MKRFLFVVAAVALTSSLFGSAAAHPQGRARGRYYTKREVHEIIKRVEDNGDRLRKYIDSDVDKTRLNETRREDRIWEQVKEFEEATDRLRKHFDRTDRWEDTRSEVQGVLREARDVGAILRRIRISARVQDTWRRLRNELNTLAGVYNLARLD